MCCMKYAEAKFLSLYFISFKEVSLNMKFRKAFKGNFADLVSEEKLSPINSVQLRSEHYWPG